jgi:hypothetical protein
VLICRPISARSYGSGHRGDRTDPDLRYNRAGRRVLLNRIRQIIAVNLPLGLLAVVTGGSGRYWG